MKQIKSVDEFSDALALANNKPVMVDFFATWCGPCRAIEPFLRELEIRYPLTVWLKVDVDEVEELVQAHSISAMPTFVAFHKGVKVGQVRGTNKEALEELVRKQSEAVLASDGGREGIDGAAGGSKGVPGYVDLEDAIMLPECECLNESDDHTFAHALSKNGGYLESDADAQLIIFVTFNQTVRLHSLILDAPADTGPATVKIFANQVAPPDFDACEVALPVQQLELTADDLTGKAPIPLKFVKFQNITRLTLYVASCQSADSETTRIDRLGFIGLPVSTTNMNDFKRVAGKKGESGH